MILHKSIPVETSIVTATNIGGVDLANILKKQLNMACLN